MALCNDGLLITLSLNRPASSAWKVKITAASPGENQARRSVIGSRQVRVAGAKRSNYTSVQLTQLSFVQLLHGSQTLFHILYPRPWLASSQWHGDGRP